MSVDVPHISRRSAVISEATLGTVRCVVAFTNFTGGGHDEQLQYVRSLFIDAVQTLEYCNLIEVQSGWKEKLK